MTLEEPRSMSADRSRAGKQGELFLDRESVTGSQPQSESHYDVSSQQFDRAQPPPLIPPKIAIYDGTRSASAAPDSQYQGLQRNDANNWEQNPNAYGAAPPQRAPQQGAYSAQDQYGPIPAGFGPPQRSATSLDPGPGGFAPPPRSATGLDPKMGGFGPPQRSMTAFEPAMGGFGPPQRSMTSQDVTMGGRGMPPRSATASISSISKGESTHSFAFPTFCDLGVVDAFEAIHQEGPEAIKKRI